jgi:hypothetical protein
MVFDVGRDTFSQRPTQILPECHEALRWHARFRSPYDDQQRGPSLSQSQVQDLVEDLEAEVTYCRKQAQEKEHWEKEKWVQTMQSFPVHESAHLCEPLQTMHLPLPRNCREVPQAHVCATDETTIDISPLHSTRQPCPPPAESVPSPSCHPSTNCCQPPPLQYSAAPS